MSLKTVVATQDRAINDIRSVRLVCDCGWVEKSFLTDAEGRAGEHLRTKHNGGLFKVLHDDGKRDSTRVH